jgi:hypothetical protein
MKIQGFHGSEGSYCGLLILTLCSLVCGHKRSGEHIASIFHPEDGDSVFLWNIGSHLPNYMM